MPTTWGIVGAGLIASLVAYSELLSRYQDDPWRAVQTRQALAYGLVNAGAGLLAAWWLATFFPNLVATAETANKTGAAPVVDGLKLTVIAGFGALVAMRTSLLKLRMPNGDDVSFGPALIIDRFMAVLDRGVDRKMAEYRCAVAASLAGKINFDQQSASLVSLCIVSLTNPAATDEQQVTGVMRALAGRTDISPYVKSMSLLLTLLGLVGEPVLRKNVDEVTGAGASSPPPPSSPAAQPSPPPPVTPPAAGASPPSPPPPAS